MKDLIDELKTRLEIESRNYLIETAKVEAGEANYHPQNLINWEERIEAIAEAIGILTKHLNK